MGLTLPLIPCLDLDQKRLSDAGWFMSKALTGSLVAKFHILQSSQGALKVGQQIIKIAVVPVWLGCSMAHRRGARHLGLLPLL
jgi:hypothetical protein